MISEQQESHHAITAEELCCAPAADRPPTPAALFLLAAVAAPNSHNNSPPPLPAAAPPSPSNAAIALSLECDGDSVLDGLGSAGSSCSSSSTENMFWVIFQDSDVPGDNDNNDTDARDIIM